jgi:hypothetical protein
VRVIRRVLLLLVLACCKSDPAAPAAPPSTIAAAPAPAPPSASASARPEAPDTRTFLWTIEGPKKSYLLGTIHVPDERVTRLPRAVEEAIAASDVVMTEIPLDPATQVRMSKQVLMAEPKTLKSELPPDLYKRLDAMFTTKGLPLALFPPMKIWAITTQIVLLDRLLQLANRKGIDSIVYDRGFNLGKEVGGLETVEEQIGTFDALSREEQVHLLRRTMDITEENKKKGIDPVEELIGAYTSADDAKMKEALLKGLNTSDPVDKKLIKRVFTDRNVKMADRIVAKITATPARSYFFAVGVAHAVTDDGLEAVLTKRGYKTSRAP